MDGPHPPAYPPPLPILYKRDLSRWMRLVREVYNYNLEVAEYRVQFPDDPNPPEFSDYPPCPTPDQYFPDAGDGTVLFTQGVEVWAWQ